MKFRLHEIEFGSADPHQTGDWYADVLGLRSTHQTEGLRVHEVGLPGLDFNLSSHHPPGAVVVSFLTDDLDAVMRALQKADIVFDGPFDSHLAMRSVAFRDPDGRLVKVNQTTSASPDWLRL